MIQKLIEVVRRQSLALAANPYPGLVAEAMQDCVSIQSFLQ